MHDTSMKGIFNVQKSIFVMQNTKREGFSFNLTRDPSHRTSSYRSTKERNDENNQITSYSNTKGRKNEKK